jgi:SAM-dependent methyltransferase
MPTYDKHYKQPNYFGEPYPELVSFFEDHEPKGNVLDLGCGQGRDSIAIARLGYTVLGVDISKVGVSQMLFAAKKENLKLSGHVADMHEYPIAESVDIVLLDSMLHFYPKDREKETRFLKRVMGELKTAGLLCIIVWRSIKIEEVLDSILNKVDGWRILLDKYVEYLEGNMDMRMLVLEKLE